MTLIKTDLLRYFAIGFLLGTAAFSAAIGADARTEVLASLLP